MRGISARSNAESADDAPLYQASDQRPTPLRVTSTVLSAILHCGIALLLAFPPASSPPIARKPLQVTYFQPAPAPERPEPPRPAPPLLALHTFLTKPVPLASPPGTKVQVDFNRMVLSFAPDTANQLPAVVAAHGGSLALLEKSENPTLAYYTFAPPDWRARPGITDVSDKWRLLMDGAERWEVFRQIAREYGLKLADYQASALGPVRPRL
jgi:hypothetical protein